MKYLNPETRHTEVENLRRHASDLRRRANYEPDPQKREQMRSLAHDVEQQLRELGRPGCP